MSVYPPLTETNLKVLNEEALKAFQLRMMVHHFPLSIPMVPGDEDVFLHDVAEFRGHLAKLDLAMFQMFGLVHRLKESNVQTTLPTPKTHRELFTTDVLEDLLK